MTTDNLHPEILILWLEKNDVRPIVISWVMRNTLLRRGRLLRGFWSPDNRNVGQFTRSETLSSGARKCILYFRCVSSWLSRISDRHVAYVRQVSNLKSGNVKVPSSSLGMVYKKLGEQTWFQLKSPPEGWRSILHPMVNLG